MICPCLECEHKDLSKQGRFIDDSGADLRVNHLYLRHRKLRDNPCYNCPKPGEYADYIEETNPMPPTRDVENYTVGSNVLDGSVDL